MSSRSTKAAARDGLLDKFFTEPPSMMNGEDADLYAALLAEVGALSQPSDIWDQMMVRDVTDHLWQQMRYRRNMGALINIYWRQALEQILIETIGLKGHTARKLADGHFDFDRTKLSLGDSGIGSEALYKIKGPFDVAELLAMHDLDESCIDQLALQISAEILRKLDDLAFRHELRREHILVEIERRRKERSAVKREQQQIAHRGGSGVAKQATNEQGPSSWDP
jgi:hypothetical protein